MTATSKTTKNNPASKFQKILKKEGEGWIGKEGRERARGRWGMRERAEMDGYMNGWMDKSIIKTNTHFFYLAIPGSS